MNSVVIAALLFIAFALGARILMTSAVAGFGRYHLKNTERVQTQLTQLFLFNDVRTLVVLYLAALLGVPMLLFMAGVNVPFIILIVIALLCFPRIVFAVLKGRRAKAISQALPDAMTQIASGMRAGSTFPMALQSLVEEDTTPLAEELSLMLREHRLGARMEDALDNLGERVQSEEMDLLVSAVLIAQDVGGNLAEILQQLATGIRRKLEMEGKISALTSQGMMQGYVVSALPFGLLAVLCLLEPEATLPVFNTVLGWIALTVMVFMQTVGALMIKKIVSIEI